MELTKRIEIIGNGNTNEQGFVIWLGTKDERMAKRLLKFSEENLEDILNCISIAKREFEKGLHKDSPNFRKAVTKLEKKTWRMLKRDRKLKTP